MGKKWLFLSGERHNWSKIKANKRLKEEASKQSIMAHPKHKKLGRMNVLIKPQEVVSIDLEIEIQ